MTNHREHDAVDDRDDFADAEIVTALAAATMTAPPRELRGRTVDRAMRRRPARSRPPLVATDSHTAPEVYLRSNSALDALLGQLRADEWTRATIDDWTVKDLVAHLVAIESYMGSLLGLWDFPLADEPLADELVSDHRRLSLATIDRMRDESPAAVLTVWRERVAAVAARLADYTDAELRQSVSFHGLRTRIASMLITRGFEIWTHGEDICRATERALPVPDAGRIQQMTSLAIRVLPLGLALIGQSLSGRTARIVLTGPGGGVWNQPLALGEDGGEPDVTLIADAIDFCRVAAQRLAPSALDVAIHGDLELGQAVLAGSAVFAA